MPERDDIDDALLFNDGNWLLRLQLHPLADFLWNHYLKFRRDLYVCEGFSSVLQGCDRTVYHHTRQRETMQDADKLIGVTPDRVSGRFAASD